jgi:uncharacterized membrane protein YkoI
MNTRWLFATLLTTLLLSGLALGDSDHQESLRLMKQGEILPLQQILDRVEQERLGRVLEVELERERGTYIYEIELLGEGGRVWEYKLDAASGEILERELED